MTPRERVLRTLKREGKPDRLPFEISWGAFTPGLMKVFKEKTGSDMTPEEYFDFDTRWVNIELTKRKTDFIKYFDCEIQNNTEFNEWGIGTVPGSKEHFVEIRYHPLSKCETAEEILAFEWPDIDAEYRYEGLSEKIKDYQNRGYAVLGDMYCTIFEIAWQLRGIEDMLMDFYLNEDIAGAICNKIGVLREKQAEMYTRLGVDVIRLGDDVCTQNGPMMSPEIYRRFIKEPTKRIIRAAKAVNSEVLIFMHSDGKVEDLIEDYIDMGIDVLNPIQPECNDIEKIMELYEGKISFWGGIGTQSTMPFGKPEDVKKSVEIVKNLLGRDGGFLVAPTHILEPEVPWENVLAFIDAAKQANY